MAIGTLGAIGLGVAGVGSLLGGASAGKGASKAADISAQTAQQNNALTEKIYNQNSATLSPFVQAGAPASQAINALLGLPGAQQMAMPTGTPVAAPAGQPLHGFARMLLGKQGMAGNPVTAQPSAAPQTMQGAPMDYNTAFDNYRNSTGYQFRMDEGMNALNSGFAGRGVLQSGAAAKAAQEYGQGIASQEFGNYMGALGNQQALGLSAASAQAGVGQNFANTISANNNSAGTAQANAALSKGANNPFANTLGLIGGGIFGMGK